MSKKSTTPKEYPTSGDATAQADAIHPTVGLEGSAIVGRPVRLHADLDEHLTGNPHRWAGKYGSVLSMSPFGTYIVAVDDGDSKERSTEAFDRVDFEVLEAATDPDQADGIEIHGTLEVTDHHLNLVEVAPAQAINSPTNPRRRRGLDIDSLRTLADSLQAHGLMQPIIVRPLPGQRLEETAGMDPRPAYEIIAGERRWRAAQMAELPTMPMLVRHLSDDQVLELQLVENIEREDLDAMEEAEGFALLREKLGYTVDQIAERIGKGKGASYVRKTMKLLDLTPESRDAMFDGHLGRSTGLLVARYPAERQAEIVKYIKSQATKSKTGTEPAPFRVIATALYTRFNTVLKDAAFDPEDAELVPTAGTCSACHKRTGFHQDLFGDAEQTATDSCTDADCFAGKKQAHVLIVRRNAEAEGCAVIEGDEAKALKPYQHATWIKGHTQLSDTAYTEIGSDGTEREVTYDDALRAMGKKAPKPTVLIDPHTSAATKIIPDELANTLKAKGQAKAGKPQQQAAPEPVVVDTRPPEVQAWVYSGYGLKRAVLLRLFDTIRSRERTIEELRNTALVLLLSECAEETNEYLGWDTEIQEVESDEVGPLLRDKLQALPADELGQIIAMASTAYLLTCLDAGTTDEQDVALIESYGIDVLAVRDKVNEDLARQAAGTANADEEDDAGEGEEGQEQGEGAAA